MKENHSLVVIDPKPNGKPTVSAVHYPIPEQQKIPLGIVALMLVVIIIAIVVLYRVLSH